MNLEELDELLDDHPTDIPEKLNLKIVKGLFGYPGGKSKSVKQLIPYLPIRDIWVDVFGGSGIVTLNRQDSKKLDVYNDRWSGVTNFFQCLRDEKKMDEMIRRLSLMPQSKEEFYLSKTLADDWNVEDDIERATRFFYMINYSFGGLGRNWGRATGSTMLNYASKLKRFHDVRLRFMRCQIDNDDFEAIFKAYDSYTTVFYCDPPYLDQHVGMYKHTFDVSEHRRLLDAAMDCKGYVAISSYTNELYDSYEWDSVKTWPVVSTMAPGKGTTTNHRKGYDTSNQVRDEVLYMKEAR